MAEVKRIKQHFVLNLWEPAAPAFCSFAKPYVGSRHDLLKVAVNMKNADPQSETAKAIQEYFGGNHEATHKIAYQEMAITNDYWSYIIWHELDDDVDFDRDYCKMVENMTAGDVQRMAQRLLAAKRCIEVTMLSE